MKLGGGFGSECHLHSAPSLAAYIEYASGAAHLSAVRHGMSGVRYPLPDFFYSVSYLHGTIPRRWDLGCVFHPIYNRIL